MRRLGRWLGRALAVLSLLMAVIAADLWRRSDTIGDWVSWYSEPHVFIVRSCQGLMAVSFGRDRETVVLAPGWHGTCWPFDRGDLQEFYSDLRTGSFLGFRYERWIIDAPGLRSDERIITFPYWLLELLLLLPPAWAAFRWHRARGRRRSIAAGKCAVCGYDLRATPDRCPECGTVRKPATVTPH